MTSGTDPLRRPRQAIDLIDNQILQLLGQRATIVKNEIIPAKQIAGLAAHQPERFEQILERLMAEAPKHGLDPQLIRVLWQTIHTHNLVQEKSQLKK